jgi:hypothetical protein
MKMRDTRKLRGLITYGLSMVKWQHATVGLQRASETERLVMVIEVNVTSIVMQQYIARQCTSTRY